MPTIVKNRRLLAGDRVLSYWQSILVDELKIEESAVKRILETHKFMCRKCFRKFDEHIKEYETLVSSLKKVAADLNLDSSASTGQKRSVGVAQETPTAKRPKPPIIVIDDQTPTNTSITTVSCIAGHVVG